MNRGIALCASVSLCCSVWLSGCGEQSAPPVAAVPAGLPNAASPGPAPTSGGDASAASEAALKRVAEAPGPQRHDDEVDLPFAAEGTPEWRLYEITRLLAPPSPQKQILSGDGSSQVVDRPLEDLVAERKQRLRQVIGHAGPVIAATHASPEQESLFTNGVHYLCAAHLELALMGEAESARQLGEVSESIYASKPASAAAVESAAYLVELARRMADRFGVQDSSWARAHATQARTFAARFPEQTSRAAMILLEAGRTCEAAGLTEAARDCYLLLTDRFERTPHADAVAAVLRRMNLPGRTLAAGDLGGATIDGGYVSIEQYRGRYVLVCFWASDSPTFASDYGQLLKLQQQYGERLAILGVNLDLDESAVDDFLEAHPLQWEQIFDPHPDERGRQNPVAWHYGVTTVPLYWVIDPQGKVLAAPASLAALPLPAP